MSSRLSGAAALAVACVAAAAAAADDWQSVNLELAVTGSKVLELTEDNIMETAAAHPVLVVWFYAPWCKQCKLIRDAFEGASNTGVDGVTFGRIDCVKYPAIKDKYEVFGYPSLKVLRGEHHRWISLPKKRTAQMIVAAAAAEVAGPYKLIDTEAELRSAIFEQREFAGGDDDDLLYRAGVGEAAAVAQLSSADGSSARAYAMLAASTDIKHSPTPFLATTVPQLLPALGLAPLAADHLVLLSLDPAAAGGGEGGAEGGGGDGGAVGGVLSAYVISLSAPLAELQAFVRGRRIPSVVRFTDDHLWGKRAASLNHVLLHGLLFHSAAHDYMLDEARRAAKAFSPGAVVFMAFNASIPEGVPPPKMPAKGMMSKYGVTSEMLPHLVFLDQRLPSGTKNRQVAYTGGAIEEKALRAFLTAQRHVQSPRRAMGRRALQPQESVVAVSCAAHLRGAVAPLNRQPQAVEKHC